MKKNGILIIYSDNEIVVAEKPGGLLSVPGRGTNKQDCLSRRLQQIFLDMPPQPAVHRLDMYTSGVMVFARSREAHRHLSRQFMQRQVKKVYEAIVAGKITKEMGESGVIRLPFRLDVENRPLQIYDPVQGKIGITRWERIAKGSYTVKVAKNDKNSRTALTKEFPPEHHKYYKNACHLRLFPETGRTHQLRTHLAHPAPDGLGTPIIGDSLYGDGEEGDTMLLHATSISFFHPEDGRQLSFLSPAPFSLD